MKDNTNNQNNLDGKAEEYGLMMLKTPSIKLNISITFGAFMTFLALVMQNNQYDYNIETVVVVAIVLFIMAGLAHFINTGLVKLIYPKGIMFNSQDMYIITGGQFAMGVESLTVIRNTGKYKFIEDTDYALEITTENGVITTSLPGSAEDFERQLLNSLPKTI